MVEHNDLKTDCGLILVALYSFQAIARCTAFGCVVQRLKQREVSVLICHKGVSVYFLFVLCERFVGIRFYYDFKPFILRSSSLVPVKDAFCVLFDKVFTIIFESSSYAVKAKGYTSKSNEDIKAAKTTFDRFVRPYHFLKSKI